MGSVVEEKIKQGGLVNVGAQSTLLEEMKLLKEMQDQSGSSFVGLVFFTNVFFHLFLSVFIRYLKGSCC